MERVHCSVLWLAGWWLTKPRRSSLLLFPARKGRGKASVVSPDMSLSLKPMVTRLFELTKMEGLGGYLTTRKTCTFLRP